MKNPKDMIESTAPHKLDRLAAFLESFKLSASVSDPDASVIGPCLMLYESPDSNKSRIVLRMLGRGSPSSDLRFTVAIEFDNATNPLMAAMPEEVSVPLHSAPSLRSTAEAFLAEVDGARCGRLAALNRLAEVMVLMMLRQVIDEGESQPGLFAALAHPSLYRALVSMHDHPAKAWTVEQLADSATMSRTQFMETFRRVVGTTPMAYLSTWRLTLAARYLRSGHSVKTVARRVGFESAEGFSRAFSRVYGHAPTDHTSVVR